ncbi:hypothetical protein [Paraburkholderia flagellata]|uniref:hypothetical protein n=1 Tax=Paraburkholderia flagellata TaxID=2883241 RepID=UPI001F1630C9|nr:hypothetical protein [Paraburkholderia flagellata]
MGNLEESTIVVQFFEINGNPHAQVLAPWGRSRFEIDLSEGEGQACDELFAAILKIGVEKNQPFGILVDPEVSNTTAMRKIAERFQATVRNGARASFAGPK